MARPSPTLGAEQACLTVACLCADWCHICTDYQTTFTELPQLFEEPIRFVWVDIEEHEALLGSLEVENFPTLLIGRPDMLMFVGPVVQKTEYARQLIRKALVSELGRLDDPALKDVLKAINNL